MIGPFLDSNAAKQKSKSFCYHIKWNSALEFSFVVTELVMKVRNYTLVYEYINSLSMHIISM